MFDYLVNFFSHEFIIYALITGILIALCAAILGVTLVLKRFSMIGDGLSHVGFGAIAAAMAFGFSPLFVSLPIVTLVAVVILRLTEKGKIKGDTAIAIVSTTGLAAGITIASFSSGFNADVQGYMFGSILSITKSDVLLSVVLTLVVVFIYVILFNRIFGITFDEDFATASGVSSSKYNTILAVLSALVIVIGMRIMGALMISSLIIFPATISMRVFKSYFQVIVCSVIVSIIGVVTGLFASFLFGSPSGASIVLVYFSIFLIFSVFSIIKNHRKIS